MHKKLFFNFLRIAILSVAMTSLLSSCFLFYDDDDDDEIAKQTSDWLILDYFDADNNLNDELYLDLVNQQCALASLGGGICSERENFSALGRTERDRCGKSKTTS